MAVGDFCDFRFCESDIHLDASFVDSDISVSFSVLADVYYLAVCVVAVTLSALRTFEEKPLKCKYIR